MIRSFRLANQHRTIGGVCAGIAYKLCVPPGFIRLILCVIGYQYFPGIIGFIFFFLYLLLWYFVPYYDNDPKDFDEVTSFH
jgi:phage shock protein PspC (stress-responsive transcriptional regulator)